MSDAPQNKLEATGQAMQSCGCILFLLPLLVVCCLFLYAVVSSMFH